MNTRLVTTGIVPLTIGSGDEFLLKPTLDDLPWSLAGGTATLILADPNGVLYNFTAQIDPTGFSANYVWPVSGPVGSWARAWKCVDVNNVTQVSQPIPFNVISSPI